MSPKASWLWHSQVKVMSYLGAEGTRGKAHPKLGWMKEGADRFLFCPMGISFFRLFEVRPEEPGWTQCPVCEASTPGDPREALSQAGKEV